MSTRATSTHRDVLDAHPRLREDIASARQAGIATFSDDQYLATLRVLEERFPGIEMILLRPWMRGEPEARVNMVAFAWHAEGIVSSGILTPEQIPPGRKRFETCDCDSPVSYVKRKARGRLQVRFDIRDDFDPNHPLAMLRRTSVEDSIPGGAAESWRERLARCSLAVASIIASTTSMPREGERFHLSAEDAARIAAIGARFKDELLEAIERARIIDTRRPQLRIVGGKTQTLQ